MWGFIKHKMLSLFCMMMCVMNFNCDDSIFANSWIEVFGFFLRSFFGTTCTLYMYVKKLLPKSGVKFFRHAERQQQQQQQNNNNTSSRRSESYFATKLLLFLLFVHHTSIRGANRGRVVGLKLYLENKIASLCFKNSNYFINIICWSCLKCYHHLMLSQTQL